MPAPAPLPLRSLLTAGQLAMIGKGVSAIVASRDADLQPSLMRAVGTAIDIDAGEVTVYVTRTGGRQLLLDIAATGRIAVVFSEPSTHLTLQLKAGAVRMRDAGAADVPVLQRYLASMERELGLIGYPAIYPRVMLGYRDGDVVALTFVPEQAFDQTPGPRAGAALPATAP